MAPTLRSALAPTFSWTTGAPDISFAFPSGTSPVTSSVASGSYRMLLASSTVDFLRVCQTAFNGSMSGSGRAETFTVSMNADSTVSIAISAGTFSATLTSLLRYLGFSANISAGTSTATSTYPPRFFAAFVSRVSADWTQVTPVSGSETAAGISYGVTSGVTTWEDEFNFDFIPQNPTQRTSLAVNQTPWHPDDANLASLGNHNPPESISDVLTSSLGKTCALALGNLQDLRTSTTERYHLVSVPAKEIAAPRKNRTRDGWDAYFKWTVRMIRQSATPTSTRA